jgi:hypothetical protein
LFAPPIIVTNSEFRVIIAVARSHGVNATIILEPQRGDSAAALPPPSSFPSRPIPARSS